MDHPRGLIYDQGTLWVLHPPSLTVYHDDDLDGATGDVVWRRDFVEELGTELPSFGCASSPLVDGDSVYVQAGMSVMRLDADTGKTIWRRLAGGEQKEKRKQEETRLSFPRLGMRRMWRVSHGARNHS